MPVDPTASADFSAAVEHYRASGAPAFADQLSDAAAGVPVSMFSIRADGSLLISWLIAGDVFHICEASAEANLTISIPLDRIRRIQHIRLPQEHTLTIELDADASRYNRDDSGGVIVPAFYSWTAGSSDTEACTSQARAARQMRASLGVR